MMKKLGISKSEFSIVRFGNVIGSDGSALPYFVKQITLEKTIFTVKFKKGKT